jgi:hypothetical protein
MEPEADYPVYRAVWNLFFPWAEMTHDKDRGDPVLEFTRRLSLSR